jgi:hypothetical protein
MCVHIRNILRAQGWYRNVKVPSSPYKRGREGTCKFIQTFLGLVLFAESISNSLRPNCVLKRVENSSCVWAVIRIFRVIPQQSAPQGSLHRISWTCCKSYSKDDHKEAPGKGRDEMMAYIGAITIVFKFWFWNTVSCCIFKWLD